METDPPQPPSSPLTERGRGPRPLGWISAPSPSLYPSLRLPRSLSILLRERSGWKLSQVMRDRGELGFISFGICVSVCASGEGAYVCETGGGIAHKLQIKAK